MQLAGLSCLWSIGNGLPDKVEMVVSILVMPGCVSLSILSLFSVSVCVTVSMHVYVHLTMLMCKL